MKHICVLWTVIFSTLLLETNTQGKDPNTTTSIETVQSHFTNVSLAYGITIDIPRSWNQLNPKAAEHLATLAEATSKNSGFTPNKGHQLLMTVRPSLSGSESKAIVSISFPEVVGTQQTIKEASQADLKLIDETLYTSMVKNADERGGSIADWQHVEMKEINGKYWLRWAYTRQASPSSRKVFVEMMSLHDQPKLITFTTEYWLNEKLVWEAICKHIRNSIQSK